MKILLCDEDEIVREGLRAIFGSAGCQVVGQADNARDMIALAQLLRPDIVVMDISTPDLNGIDATRSLVARCPGTRVVGLSVNSDRHHVAAMFRAGAVGYLLKNSAAAELIQAVHTVMSGRIYLSPAITGVREPSAPQATDAASPPSSGPPPSSRQSRALSPREREVLTLLAEGRSSKDIAVRLLIAPSTVETYRRQLMDKLDLRTIAELTKFAIREGLTSLE